MRLAEKIRNAWKVGHNIIWDAARGWSRDGATTHAAALAYYAIFSVAPLLILTVALAGWILGHRANDDRVFIAIRDVIGTQGANSVMEFARGASARQYSGKLAGAVGVGTLLIGASSAFVQMRYSLNSIWKVSLKRQAGLEGFLLHRALTFVMILVIALLFLAWLLVSSAIAAAGRFLSGHLPGGWAAALAIWQWVGFAVSFGLSTIFFAAIYKVLPDVSLRWRDTWIGAVLTALLFVLGKFGISVFLGKSAIASGYGAAASALVVLIWIYFSACILYFGAEVTHVVATRETGARPGEQPRRAA